MSNSEHVVATLQSDFKDIRALATCSICDQLLYEPWTIACGHTYCYSVRESKELLTPSTNLIQCLCSWFSQNKRKKSCPECRAKVKTMPAPSFLIKQVVELIIKRSELMPADESIEQHQKRRAEEMSLFDCDKTSAKGLFKGMFSVKQNSLWRDNSDGVLRCSGCGFEHEGGPLCTNCGEQINEDEDEDEYMEDNRRNDMEIDSMVIDLEDEDLDEDEYVEEGGRNDVELDSMGFDLYDESDEDGSFNFNNYHHFQQHIASYVDMAYPRRPAINYTPEHFGLNRNSAEVNLMEGNDSEDTELSEAYDSSSDIDEDGGSSLEDFIIPDGEEEDESDSSRSVQDQHSYRSSPSQQQNTITISDDGSDEGGEISNRRQIRRRPITHRSVVDIPSSIQSVDTFIGTSSNESESSDRGSEIGPLKYTEWSSSDHEKRNGKDKKKNLTSNSYNRTLDSDDESHTDTKNPCENDMFDDDNDSQERRRSGSEISNYASSSTRNSANPYGISESSESKSSKRRLDQSTSLSWDRNPNDERTSPFTDDDNENEAFRNRSRQNSPYFVRNGEIPRKVPLSTDMTHRKRPAWESSILDAEAEAENSNSNSRRSKSWAISRMPHNSRGNETASPVRNLQTISRIESNSYLSFQPESTGLANVVHAVDEESDDSVQPPSRRHPRHQKLISRADRGQTRIGMTFSGPQSILGTCHLEDSYMNQPTSRNLQWGPGTKIISANRTTTDTFLLDLPKNAIASINSMPSFALDLTESILRTETLRKRHARIRI